MSFRHCLRVVRVAAFGFAFFLTGALSSAAFAGDCIGCVVQEVSGKVGVGTTGPLSTLEVYGITTLGRGSNLDNGGADIAWMHGNNALEIGVNRSRGAVETDFISSPGTGAAGGFGFYVAPGGGSTINPLMYIQGNTGNVGIGTTGPVSTLDVEGDSKSETGAAGGACSPNGATVAAAYAASGQNLICSSSLWAVVSAGGSHGSYRMFCTCDTNNTCPCTPTACAGGDTTLTTAHNAQIGGDPNYGGANTLSLYEIWCLH